MWTSVPRKKSILSRLRTSHNIRDIAPDTVREGFRPVTNDGSNVATSCNPVRSALAPSTSKYGSNIYNPNPDAVKEGLRPIVIDGSNVAMGHGNGLFFSCRGLQICIDYFLKLNHKVIAFVPKYRRSSPQSKDTDILDKLEKQGLLTFTPSRRIGDRLVVAYDDRYIVQYAAECGGVIVSTDNYRDLLRENPAWRETIENRLLMFTWVGDIIMFPQDPLGRYGPNLENFLRFPAQQ
ncbi:probable ribonuclease ZC3H12D isoform X2 [Periplaneta americana]|uniref:probable ribonuclease ZC3H12D isoform X2 n=1 Tax=Periplaneta americana TaxID=6978 RepID=UPI0037E7012E